MAPSSSETVQASYEIAVNIRAACCFKVVHSIEALLRPLHRSSPGVSLKYFPVPASEYAIRRLKQRRDWKIFRPLPDSRQRLDKHPANKSFF